MGEATDRQLGDLLELPGHRAADVGLDEVGARQGHAAHPDMCLALVDVDRQDLGAIRLGEPRRKGDSGNDARDPSYPAR